ncbi:MAG: SgcJ/EcaC family oxidoreductase [Pseudomonadota bacterium]
MAVHRPEDLPGAFVGAWMARDGEALGALFTEDARFVNVVGDFWHSRAEIAEAHGHALSTAFRRTTLDVLETERFDPVDGMALLHIRWRLSGQIAPGGGDAPAREGLLLFVCIEGTEGWSVATAQNTDIDPDHTTTHGRRR